MKSREPEFMKELHIIRAKLSRKWEKMSNAELTCHLHKIGNEFKRSLRFKKPALSDLK